MSYPIDATIKGMALDSFGFTAENTIAGLGLNTFGFLWPCNAIWSPCCGPVTTVWTNAQTGDVTVETCV